VQIGDRYLHVFETTGHVVPASRSADLTSNPAGIDHISFSVDSVDGEFARISENGVVFDGEPVSVEAWGIRLAGFSDPEGNRYYLVESL